jgi:exodeoxyribonuclease V alpha subunit
MEISVAGQGSKMLELSEEQKQALTFVANNTITVITGGPGCGKTTVVKAVSKMLREAGLKVGLAAPTGRAAQRLGEVCGLESSTIHRLLKFDPMRGSFVHNKKDLLDYEALILDECSMIDISLAARALEALDGRARLVLVGDADQLPSVGPGRFLGDLLEVPEIPRVRLNQLFRRTEESSINHIAHSINSSEVPRIPEPDGKTKSDSYFLRAPTPEDAVSLIEKLVSDQIPRKFADSFNIGPKDIMVLSPMNKGNLGVITLNQRLQEKFIPEERRNSKVRCGALTFYLGDRVIQRVNNYNIDPAGVFNGDQGEIIAIDAEAQIVTVRLWDGREVEYSSKELLELDLAYALTIHRSQGSEVPVVVLALHDTHNFMLERQLLYTAVTRAKKLLIVVGSKRALNIAIKRVRSTKRHTNLVKRTGSDSGQLSLT